MNHSKLTGASGALRFQIIPAGSIRCNAVVLWHDQSRDAVIVDPTDDARQVIAFSRRLGLRVHHVLITHAHFEHCADAKRAATEFGCPAGLHPADYELFYEIPQLALSFGQNISPRKLVPAALEDDQVIEVLPEFPITVLHVPGHSAGSVAFHLHTAHWLCVGDTLFRGGMGRTDLPGGNPSEITQSIESRLYVLPEETLVIPGHGPITTIGQEKREQRAAPRTEPTL